MGQGIGIRSAPILNYSRDKNSCPKRFVDDYGSPSSLVQTFERLERVLSKTTVPASSSSAVQTHLRNNTVLCSFICLSGICSYFWVALVTAWNPVHLFTLSLVSEGDQKWLWDWMNTGCAPIHN